MLTVLSPAKKLSKECFVKTNNHNLPQFLDDSVGLAKELKKNDTARVYVLNGNK